MTTFASPAETAESCVSSCAAREACARADGGAPDSAYCAGTAWGIELQGVYGALDINSNIAVAFLRDLYACQAQQQTFSSLLATS